MDYFPLSIAVGGAFCNREKEQKNLQFNLTESRPTLIVSPRRYGKTSLANQVITRSKLPCAYFDFLAAVSESDVEKIILKGVSQLLGQFERGPKKLLKLATDFFAGLNIKLSFDQVGLSVEISKNVEATSDNLLGILERVDQLSKK